MGKGPQNAVGGQSFMFKFKSQNGGYCMLSSLSCKSVFPEAWHCESSKNLCQFQFKRGFLHCKEPLKCRRCKWEATDRLNHHPAWLIWASNNFKRLKNITGIFIWSNINIPVKLLAQNILHANLFLKIGRRHTSSSRVYVRESEVRFTDFWPVLFDFWGLLTGCKYH